MNEWENLTINCDINDVLYHMNEAEYGAHYIIIYPNLATIRQLYASYIPKQIQENNEIVLVNRFMKLPSLLDKFFPNVILIWTYRNMKKKNLL
jgi:hypothetical protein